MRSHVTDHWRPSAMGLALVSMLMHMATVGPMRLLLDTNVYDWLDASAEQVNALDDAVRAGRAEVILTHVQVDELARIPDRDRDKRVRLVRLAFILASHPRPTGGGLVGTSALGAFAMPGDDLVAAITAVLRGTDPRQPRKPTNFDRDAPLAATAIREGAALVTTTSMTSSQQCRTKSARLAVFGL